MGPLERSVIRTLLPVNIATMTNVENRHDPYHVANFIYHTVVSDTDSPTIAAGELLAPARPRIIAQRSDGVPHPFIILLWQSSQFFLRTSKDLDLIAHLRPRSISWTACSNGTASSSEALAKS